MKKLKICFLANAESIHTRRWVSFFSQKYEVFLIDTSTEDIIMENVKIFKIESGPSIVPRGVYVLWRMRKILNEISPDFLHIHFFGWRGVLACFSTNIPIIVTAWGSDIFLTLRDGNFFQKMLKRIALQRVRVVTADSEDLLRAAISLGARKDAGRIIQFGVDTNVFHAGYNVEGLKTKLGIQTKYVIFSPRGFKNLYNTDIIVKAFATVAQRRDDVTLLLGGFVSDTALRRYVEELVDNFNLRARVIFAEGIDHKEMPLYYNLSDVVVSVPSTDGTPVSLLEAMSCGCGLVYSDLPSIKEWIDARRNGFLVPVYDERKTAQAIIDYLYLDEREKAEWRKRNRLIVEKRAEYRVNMEKMEQIYLALLNKR